LSQLTLKAFFDKLLTKQDKNLYRTLLSLKSTTWFFGKHAAKATCSTV